MWLIYLSYRYLKSLSDNVDSLKAGGFLFSFVDFNNFIITIIDSLIPPSPNLPSLYNSLFLFGDLFRALEVVPDDSLMLSLSSIGISASSVTAVKGSYREENKNSLLIPEINHS